MEKKNTLALLSDSVNGDLTLSDSYACAGQRRAGAMGLVAQPRGGA